LKYIALLFLVFPRALRLKKKAGPRSWFAPFAYKGVFAAKLLGKKGAHIPLHGRIGVWDTQPLPRKGTTTTFVLLLRSAPRWRHRLHRRSGPLDGLLRYQDASRLSVDCEAVVTDLNLKLSLANAIRNAKHLPIVSLCDSCLFFSQLLDNIFNSSAKTG